MATEIPAELLNGGHCCSLLGAATYTGMFGGLLVDRSLGGTMGQLATRTAPAGNTPAKWASRGAVDQGNSLDLPSVPSQHSSASSGGLY
jgi:hypothetical protein